MNDKCTTIDGKFYKEHQLVMLPTEKAKVGSKDILLCIKSYKSKTLNYDYDEGIKGELRMGVSLYAKDDLFQKQHLYFLSDEDIKEGDWKLEGFVYAGAKVIQHKGDTIKSESGDNGFEVKKIIATTDSELTICKGVKKVGESCNYNNNCTFPNCCLPRPSNSFIEKFVSEWNKGNKIDKVLVEYFQVNKTIVALRDAPNFMMKIVPDNTITIKPLVVKDKIYTTDQVEQLLNDYGKDMIIACQLKKEIPYYVDWLKQQNL